MFKAGMFSSDENQPYQVDAEGLKKLTVDAMAKALQVSESNPISGLEGRAKLLIRLSGALRNQEFFGSNGRPGNMLGEYTAISFELDARLTSTQTTSSPIRPRKPLLFQLYHSLLSGTF